MANPFSEIFNEAPSEAPSRMTRLRAAFRKAAGAALILGGTTVLVGSGPFIPGQAGGVSMIARGVEEYQTADEQEGLPDPQPDTDLLDVPRPIESPAPLDGN